MATVIGTDTARKPRATCKHCLSIIEYTPSEVRTLWEGTDYGGGPDGAKGFTCPTCSRDVITERW